MRINVYAMLQDAKRRRRSESKNSQAKLYKASSNRPLWLECNRTKHFQSGPECTHNRSDMTKLGSKEIEFRSHRVKPNLTKEQKQKPEPEGKTKI
jgi:hypothetical protein